MYFVLALLPAVVIDKFLKKKGFVSNVNRKTCKKLMIIGALTTIAAVCIELLADEFLLLTFDENTYGYVFFDNFFSTACAEEGVKFFALLMFAYHHMRKHSGLHNTISDGCIYGMYVGLGFALFENIIYSLDGDTFVMVLRSIFAVPGHVVYGYIMGEYLQKVKDGKRGYFIIAFLLPTIQHGLYDFCLSGELWELFLLAFVNEIVLYKLALKKIYASLDVFKISISCPYKKSLTVLRS